MAENSLHGVTVQWERFMVSSEEGIKEALGS